MAKVIGIDLGTTNSVVAHEDHTGVNVVLNRANERCTPSVVGLPYLKPGEKRKPDVSIGSPDLLIGTLAVDNAERNSENTIFSIKRLMGRFYEDPNVQMARQRCRYSIVKSEDGDDVRVALGGRMLTPVEVSAMILSRLKEDARTRLGDEVSHAVITVPAYFSVNQRLATRTAGETAGLRVKAIIDEPTAAAMAFGVDLEPGAMKTVLVYDLGGGTFDISLLFIAGEMFTQMAIEGDMWLGGDDFDHAIMEYVLKQVRQEYQTDPSGDNRFMLLLKKAAEKAKKTLSEMLSTAIVISNSVQLPGGRWEDVDVEISRRDFEDLPISPGTIKLGGIEPEELRNWCQDLKINGTFTDHAVEFGPDTVRNRIKKTILLARKAMLVAGVARDQIDHVLLVGGSTTIPLVQAMLENEFGADKIMRNIDPMGCVAMGAGIAAARIPGIICQNVVGRSADGKDILCQESNGEGAAVCRKCQAPLVAQKQCPQCSYANEMDAASCANPAGCPHVFRRIDAPNVTAKPIGIHVAGDRYEVIVPKSTAYPTLEPVVRMFRTAENTQRAVRVPIYHAEMSEFDPREPDQWVGAADIDLEGAHLPAETRVAVGVGIDRDGCLDIEASIQDGSGRRLRVFIDPRLGSAMPPAAPLVPEAGEPGAPAGPAQQATPDWVNRLLWSIVCAETALQKYEWLFNDHRVTQTLQQMVQEGREVIERKDETRGRELEASIDKTMEGALGGAMVILHAEMACYNPSLEPAKRSQLQSQIKEVCDALRSRADAPTVQGKVDRMVELMVEARKTGPVEQRGDKGTLLH